MGGIPYRFLRGACAGFAVFGVLAAFFGMSFVFSVWREFAADALFEDPAAFERLGAFAPATLGILGGSIAGKWVAAFWLVREPLARAERWSWWALLAGLLLWFGIDSTMSIVHRAFFNVWMINLGPLLLVGVPLLLVRGGLGPSEPHERPVGAARVLFQLCVGLAAFGVAVAVASTSPLFGFYSRWIVDAFFAGEPRAEAQIWQGFIYGPIGATFAAHFAMLAAILRCASSQPWAYRAVITSMLAWFVPDTLTGMLHGAWFNVLWINVPSMAAIGGLWLFARRPPANAALPGNPARPDRN